MGIVLEKSKTYVQTIKIRKQLNYNKKKLTIEQIDTNGIVDSTFRKKKKNDNTQYVQ